MFDWDRENVEYIFQHDISPQEAEEAFYDPDRSIHHAHSGNRKIIGMTEDGRLLAIIYTKREKKIRPITGWDATETERKSYNRKRRQ
ncbi:BrnT family toxin [Metabacillus sp. FJAT-52054]|uniref:BrnT family toxin n=1 Tax=Metabacillus sediminis TaxID=3117746 RepID=A0ABZ2NHX0_9BACI